MRTEIMAARQPSGFDARRGCLRWREARRADRKLDAVLVKRVKRKGLGWGKKGLMWVVSGGGFEEGDEAGFGWFVGGAEAFGEGFGARIVAPGGDATG